MFTSATHDFLDQEWQHHDGFLNACRITGYLRRGDGGSFHLVQNNLASLALPIHLDRGCLLPDVPENSPLTARCRVGGRADADGNRVAFLTAFEVVVPAADWLPPDYAFMNPVPEDAIAIDFVPAETGITHDCDGSNLVRLAGFASDITLESVDNARGVNGKLSFLLVQADRDLAIPVRCYGRLASVFANRIEEGSPIQIAASFRVDAKRIGAVDGTGKSILSIKPYLHAISDPMFVAEDMIDESAGKAIQESLVKSQPTRRRKPAAQAATAGA